MKEIVEKLRQKGYEALYKKISTVETLTVQFDKKCITFYKNEYHFVQQLEFDMNIVEIFKYDAKIIDDIFSYFHQGEKPLLIFLEGDSKEDEALHFLEKRGYQKIEEIEKIRYYDRLVQKGSNLILKADEIIIEEKLNLWSSLERTLSTWQEKELLVHFSQLGSKFFYVHLNGLDVEMEITKQHGTLILQIRKEKKIVKEIKYEKANEIEKELDNWIETKIKQQRVRSLTHPSTYFFDKWIDEMNAGDVKEKIYHAFLHHYQGNEVEQITANYVKNISIVRFLDHNKYLLDFKEKVILLNLSSCEISLFNGDEHLQKNLVDYLIKKEKENIEKLVKSALH